MNPRDILAWPQCYILLQNLVGAARVRRVFVNEYIHPVPGMKILDVGCGTGDVLSCLPEVQYYGYDPCAAYIKRARKRFGARGRFACASSCPDEFRQAAPFDVVVTMFVLHHLPDDDVRAMGAECRRLLRPGGRLIAIEPCLVAGQSWLARRIILSDRGKHMRSELAYLDQLRPFFPKVHSAIRHDLLRHPYTHVIIEAA
jgi:SAM-dependent methyltransferase